MDKHAYLIMAYNNPNQLLSLIGLLDDPRNDIYVHIDKDADFPMEIFTSCTCKATLTLVPRVSVRWAHYSQVEAELQLLHSATEHDKYLYYHLLSGMDLPLKSQDYIHDYFRDKNTEFIGIVPYESKYNLRHVISKYPLLKYKRYRSSTILKLLSEAMASIQMMLYSLGLIKRKRLFREINTIYYDGWQWFSITDSFARFVISHEQSICSVFSDAKAPDEMVLQTLAMNSEFSNRIQKLDDLCVGSARMIDWKRGAPYTYRVDDFQMLMSSDSIFARKFDERVDSEIVSRIIEALKN